LRLCTYRAFSADMSTEGVAEMVSVRPIKVFKMVSIEVLMLIVSVFHWRPKSDAAVVACTTCAREGATSQHKRRCRESRATLQGHPSNFGSRQK
jgi:hypothetical protein